MRVRLAGIGREPRGEILHRPREINGALHGEFELARSKKPVDDRLAAGLLPKATESEWRADALQREPGRRLGIVEPGL